MGLGQDMAPLTGPHHAFFLWMIGVKGFWGAGQIAGGCRLRQTGDCWLTQDGARTIPRETGQVTDIGVTKREVGMNNIGDTMKGGISAILISTGYIVLWCGAI